MEHDKAKLSFLVALNKCQGLLEPAKKDSLNPHFKSRYASLASVNEAVMGPLAEAGFVLLSGGIDINGVPHLRTTLYHVAGHSESFDYPLIKNTENPQHVASSFTYARRYSICALLNLSTEDDDGNAAADSVKTVTRQPATAKAPTQEARAAAQTSTAAPGVETAKGVVSEVTERLVKSTGKPAWDVTIDGKKMSTLDEAQANLAMESRDTERVVNIGYKTKG